MAFKLKSGNTTNFKKMGSSPAKRAGIFEGEGIDRVRISKNEADEKEASGATDITRTALDNPDKEEGAQQVKNLKGYHADIDADLQVRKNADEGKKEGDYKHYKEGGVHGWGDSGSYTTKDAEIDIREHENVVGGDPSVTEGKRQYQVNGEWIGQDEFDKYREQQKNNPSTTTTTTTKGKPTTTYKPGKPMTSAEYRALLKKNKNK